VLKLEERKKGKKYRKTRGRGDDGKVKRKIIHRWHKAERGGERRKGDSTRALSHYAFVSVSAKRGKKGHNQKAVPVEEGTTKTKKRKAWRQKQKGRHPVTLPGTKDREKKRGGTPTHALFHLMQGVANKNEGRKGNREKGEVQNVLGGKKDRHTFHVNQHIGGGGGRSRTSFRRWVFA